mmetsp:Transcript_27910/g.57144  ORF Transcript_27910/g.57144 Transcript_27910/m.57144 type:complete len:338 (-) Transcript_27910:1279-2292(-)
MSLDTEVVPLCKVRLELEENGDAVLWGEQCHVADIRCGHRVVHSQPEHRRRPERVCVRSRHQLSDPHPRVTQRPCCPGHSLNLAHWPGAGPCLPHLFDVDVPDVVPLSTRVLEDHIVDLARNTQPISEIDGRRHHAPERWRVRVGRVRVDVYVVFAGQQLLQCHRLRPVPDQPHAVRQPMRRVVLVKAYPRFVPVVRHAAHKARRDARHVERRALAHVAQTPPHVRVFASLVHIRLLVVPGRPLQRSPTPAPYTPRDNVQIQIGRAVSPLEHDARLAVRGQHVHFEEGRLVGFAQVQMQRLCAVPVHLDLHNVRALGLGDASLEAAEPVRHQLVRLH